MMTIGSLFAGIGGFELGLEWAGFGPVLWQVEKDPFCRRVLRRHWPEARRHGRIETFRAADFPAVDLVCGGFPCQDISSAGKGAGLAGLRSRLWYQFERVVSDARPRVVVVENVASGKRRWLCEVRGALEALRYRTSAVGVSASDVGAPHRRARVFVIAYADGRPVRDEPRRQRGANGTRATVASYDGHQGPMADADHQGNPRQAPPWDAVGVGPSRQGHARLDGSPWAAEPCVGRVADGIPDRMDRLRGLGNAVVPQCAMVVGLKVRVLLGDPHIPQAQGLLFRIRGG